MKVDKAFERINGLSLPTTILLASIILGGFYFLSETNKQASIERQQQAEVLEKQNEVRAQNQKEDVIATEKASCVSEAQQNAVNLYNNSSFCTGSYPAKDCNTGIYLVAQYDTAYNTCLQRMGLK